MSQSNTINKLAAALVKVQAELKPVSRNAENPFFKSSYADLAACINHASPLLVKNGLAVIQTGEPTTKDGELVIKTTLIHESGEWISGEMNAKLAKNDPQGAGSAVTYLRRYGYSAIIGLAQEGEDDDGNQGSGKTGQERPPESPAPNRPQVHPKPATTRHKPTSSDSDSVPVDVLFVGYKKVERPTWTAWFCTFETDSGSQYEAGTFDAGTAENLDTLKGQICTIKTRPGKKAGTLELLSIEPQCEIAV